MVCLRNLLRNDPPLSVFAVERQAIPGGIWTGHIPAYSTLQDLKIEYEVHGVKFPQKEPQRRAPRDQIAEWCEAYVQEFALHDHILWQHDVVSVEMVKPMLHRVVIKPFVGDLEKPINVTVFTRAVLVCT
jgi:cation diffusion facilitator CzcD-associated flavoprotein CzcO